MTEWDLGLPTQRKPRSPHWGTPSHRDEVWEWCTVALGPVFGPITAMTQTKLRA